jgi:hypothetical protein
MKPHLESFGRGIIYVWKTKNEAGAINCPRLWYGEVPTWGAGCAALCERVNRKGEEERERQEKQAPPDENLSGLQWLR